MSGECDICGEHCLDCMCNRVFNMVPQGENIYRPENYKGPQAQNASIGVKFCTDIFVHRSFLDKHNIEYKEEDLEMGPLGLGVRIKRD